MHQKLMIEIKSVKRVSFSEPEYTHIKYRKYYGILYEYIGL